MREILFTAKRTKDGKWVEGDLNRCIVVGKTHICRIEKNLSTTIHEVEGETVCQYTGMTDKKGVRIWENDRCWVERPCVFARGTIKYLEGCFCFVEDNTNTILRLCDVRKNGYTIKVKGNVFNDNKGR